MTDVKDDPLEPNSEDMRGPYWDPWLAMGVPCGGYSSTVDDDALSVLRAINDGTKSGRAGGEYRNYVTEITKTTSLSETHVELYQYLFCSANWCEYGTSPRGCWFVYDYGEGFGDRLITAWEEYYQRKWVDDQD